MTRALAIEREGVAVRYYLGQPVIVDASLPPERFAASRDGGEPGMVEGVEFADAGGGHECEAKMDAMKEGRRCKRGTDGCIAKHTSWAMWGPQLKEEPWG